jgi:hypothetical protein
MSPKVAYLLYGSVWNFQYCQSAKNQPKSHILFHKNDLPLDLYALTLGVLCGGGVPRFFGIIIEPGTTLWSKIEILI